MATATTYSSRYQIKLIGTGQESTTWGVSTNENLSRIEEVLGGSSVVSVDSYASSGTGVPTWNSGTKTLTWITYDTADSGSGNPAAGTPSAAGRSGMVVFTSTEDLEGTVTVDIRGNDSSSYPDRLFVAKNALPGDQTLNLCLNGTDLAIGPGKSVLVFTSATAKGPGTEIAANSVNNALANLQLTSLSATSVVAGLTGDVTGNLTGDVYASNGTSKVLESGTNGTDSTYTGDLKAEDGAVVVTSGANLGASSLGNGVGLGTPGAGVLTSCTGLPLTTGVTGTLPVANGGTGAASLTDGGVLLGSGTGAITATSVLGDGEILIGDASGDPATLDVGSSTAITILGTVATGVWNGTAITGDYIDATSSPLENTKIWIGDSSGDAREFALSGDATMTAGGAVTVSTAAACSGNAATVTNGVYTTNNLSVMAATTSAQLAGVISDETGSGKLVFDTSPTLVTPALGTPSAGVLSSCTAYPGDSSLVTTGTVATGTWSSDITMGAGDNLEVDGGTIKLNGDYPSSGNYNAAMGLNALESITDGTNNVSIGRNSGRDLTTEDQNVFVGVSAGENVCSTGETEGDNNTFVGHQSGYGVDTATTASDNSGIGSCSLESITTGTHNTFLGRRSGYTLTEGAYNCGIGFDSGDDVTTGAGNTFLGTKAGQGVQSGDYNVTIGYRSGDSDGANTLGDNKLVIHSESGGTADPATEALIYGEFDTGTVHFNSSGNTATTGVSIQNTRVSGSGFNFLRCIADADGTPATKFQVRGDGQVQVNGVEVHAADYADMFEWADGNPDAEDRIGLSVVLDGEGGIRIATGSDAAEDVVGIVSGTACMVGNAAWSSWDKTFLKDDFGRPTDQPNPDYDESLEYVPRGDRAEWAIIGLTGRVHLRKGSPANPLWRKIRDVSAVTEEWLVR